MKGGTINPNAHLPLYFARSSYIHQEGGLGSNDIYRQCFVKKNDEALEVLNQDFPLISANQGVKGFTYEVSDILNNHEIFKAQLKENLPIDSITRVANATRQLIFVTQGIDKQQSISEVFWFMNAKVPPDFLDEDFAFYKKTYDVSQGLLTNRNHTILTDLDCPQYVYYCNTLGNLDDLPAGMGRELILKCFIRRKNGTSETITIDTITGLNPYDIIAANVSLSKIPNPETVIYYTVFFTKTDGTPVNKAKYFLPDRNTPENTTYLLFRNLYGLFETVRCTGETAIDYQYEHRSFDSNTVMTDYNTEAHEVYTFNTGEISRGELNYLANELMTSTEMYLITDNGYIQLSKNSKSMMKYDPAKAYDSATFEMRKAKTDIF